MRHRVTFFHRHEHGIEPSALKIHDRSMSGPDFVAVREHRVTLALDELPAELQELLRDVRELHIRWSQPRLYETLGPWNSRLPPGLHVFYTPQTASAADSPRLCLQLRAALGDIDCLSPAESFTKLPTDRFSHATEFQYFQPLDTLAHLSKYAEQYASGFDDTERKLSTRELEQALSFDLSYDAVAHTVKITAVWPEGHQKLSINAHPDHRTEVGILTPDSPPHLESHELGVTGLLTVLGEDTKPSPVLFAFPSRHKNAGSTYSSTFLQPLGLHPTLQLSIDSSESPLPDSTCSLYAYLTLPRTIFVDKYQLGDDLFLSSKNLTALRYISQPVDLEAPDYAMKVWGSSVLLELQPPNAQGETPWTAEIPLHLRYLSPAEGGYSSITVPGPAVFWACDIREKVEFPNGPFDRTNLGYDGLFNPQTLFWHINPKSDAYGSLNHKIRVPVLDSNQTEWVSIGTATVVLIGFAYIVFKLASVYWRTGYGSQRQPPAEPEKKEQ
ncbi:PIG-X [Xylaria sp. CBS 124048]|nr:PIG-X [Xylaria sp. CBS 124048]